MNLCGLLVVHLLFDWRHMPSISTHPVSENTNVLVAGESGVGKTALLATLANAGYNLRILDYDNGLDILSDFLKPEAMDRVHYVTLRDSFTEATAWQDGLKILSHWKTDTEDFGCPKDWGKEDVLVIDSLTFMAISALKRTMQVAGKKLTDRPAIGDWGDAINDLKILLDDFASGEYNCSVVINTHIQYMEDAAGGKKLYPTVIGNSLPPIVGRYFNNVIRLDVKPGKNGGSRILRTTSDYKMALKNSAPSVVEPEMEADLAKFLQLVQDNARKKQGKDK